MGVYTSGQKHAAVGRAQRHPAALNQGQRLFDAQPAVMGWLGWAGLGWGVQLSASHAGPSGMHPWRCDACQG